jgi:hypothetical protein
MKGPPTLEELASGVPLVICIVLGKGGEVGMAKVKVSGYARVTKSSPKTVKVTSVSSYTRKKPSK